MDGDEFTGCSDGESTQGRAKRQFLVVKGGKGAPEPLAASDLPALDTVSDTRVWDLVNEIRRLQLAAHEIQDQGDAALAEARCDLAKRALSRCSELIYGLAGWSILELQASNLDGHSQQSIEAKRSSSADVLRALLVGVAHLEHRTFSDLAEALDALNHSEVRLILSPSKKKGHTRAYSRWEHRLFALHYVAFHKGMGGKVADIQETVVQAFGYEGNSPKGQTDGGLIRKWRSRMPPKFRRYLRVENVERMGALLNNNETARSKAEAETAATVPEGGNIDAALALNRREAELLLREEFTREELLRIGERHRNLLRDEI